MAPGLPRAGQRLNTSVYLVSAAARLRLAILPCFACSFTAMADGRRTPDRRTSPVLYRGADKAADGRSISAADGTAPDLAPGSGCRSAGGETACAVAGGSVAATAIMSRSTPTRCTRATAPAANPANNAPHAIQNTGPRHSP